MNLVQINERLKDLPMQVVQQYANGMNPEVPPYLALGELQRREMSQKQMATAQGAQQGPQPSIKEQVEQKAGLMQLQQMQQQQMAQQMAQPRGPMPASEGTPQPVDQPEVAMAGGGLASVPMRSDMFEYASGGIIAFAKGDTVEDPRRNRQEGESFADFRKRMFDLDLQLQREKNAAQESGREAERQRRIAERGEEFAVPPSPFVDRPALPTPSREPMVTSQGPGTQVVPRRPIEPTAGLPAAIERTAPAVNQKPPVAAVAPPAAPRPAAPTGIAAALPQAAQAPTNVSPFMAEAATMAREKPVAPTPASVIAEQNQLMPAGMKEEAMKELLDKQRARADARQAAYEGSKPTGLQDFIRVMGQAGQSKGFSGLAPAYTALQQQRRTEDLAMQKQQDELLTAIEGRGMAFDKDVFGARTGAMTAANKAFQDRLLTNTKALADLAGVDQRRMDEALGRLTQVQIEKMRIAARAAEASRPGEAERIEATYMGMVAKGKQAEADAYLERISKIKGGGSAGVGAENSQTRMLREALKDVNGRLEFMDPKDPEYKILSEQSKRLSQRVVDRALKEAGEGGGGKPITKAEYDKLPKGATYTAPDGTQRTKG